MPTHSESMRNVQPPLQRSTVSQWRDLINSRPHDEPHPAFGAIIACALLGFLIVGLFAAAIMIGV